MRRHAFNLLANFTDSSFEIASDFLLTGAGQSAPQADDISVDDLLNGRVQAPELGEIPLDGPRRDASDLVLQGGEELDIILGLQGHEGSDLAGDRSVYYGLLALADEAGTLQAGDDLPSVVVAEGLEQGDLGLRRA